MGCINHCVILINTNMLKKNGYWTIDNHVVNVIIFVTRILGMMSVK